MSADIIETLLSGRLADPDGGPPRLCASAASRASVETYFGAEPGAACWSEFSAKRLDAEAAEALSARLAERWDEFHARLSAVMVPAAELDSV